MILNQYQKSDLFDKLHRVFIELDKTEFVKTSAASVPLDKREKLGFYFKYGNNPSEYFFSCAWNHSGGTEYRAADTSLELINLARELIRTGKDLLGVKEDNDDTLKAMRKFDDLEKVYNEMEKSLSNTQLIAKLDEIISTIKQNQDASAKSLAELKTKLDKKPDKSELRFPDNGLDIFSLKNRVNELKDEVTKMAANVTALKARADAEDKKLEQKKHRRLFG